MPLDNSNTVHIYPNSWSEDLYRRHGELDARYVLIDGGRGSSKTFEISQALIIKGHLDPLRICVAREHLKSIQESAKIELEDRSKHMGLIGANAYTFLENKVDHANGTHFFFISLSKLSEEDIKGLSLVDIVWVEEAHTMSARSWELLRPTIRKPGSQIICSWNPRYRTDAISDFMERTRDEPRVWYKRINFNDNNYFTPELEEERLLMQRTEPERYAHIWLGEYDDASAKRKVLPYALLERCVEAWDRRPVRGAFAAGGLDVADTGVDKNALAIRCGPELFHITTWRGSQSFTPSDTARQSKEICEDNDVRWLRYDAGGPGAGVRGPMRDLSPSFQVRGVQFGGKVELPDVTFIRRGTGGSKTNEQYFRNWASQAGWSLRLRANNTQRLLDGENINPDVCLFINPEIPNLKRALAAMAQPEWDDSSGKLKIDKQPREPGETEPPSPDEYDAAIMAFAGDLGRPLTRLLVENRQVAT